MGFETPSEKLDESHDVSVSGRDIQSVYDDECEYPTPGRAWIIMSCLYMTMFLVALVRLILQIRLTAANSDSRTRQFLRQPSHALLMISIP